MQITATNIALQILKTLARLLSPSHLLVQSIHKEVFNSVAGKLDTALLQVRIETYL